MGRPIIFNGKIQSGSNVICAWESHFFGYGFWLDPFYRLSSQWGLGTFLKNPGPGDEVSVWTVVLYFSRFSFLVWIEKCILKHSGDFLFSASIFLAIKWETTATFWWLIQNQSTWAMLSHQLPPKKAYKKTHQNKPRLDPIIFPATFSGTQNLW